MKYTNKYGMPSPFFRAVINDGYDSGDSDYTATSLANPPRASALIKKHFSEIEIDVSTRVASIIGQGAHYIAERAARPEIDICEHRFFAQFALGSKSYKVSAQIDLYEKDSCALFDWKTTKSYAFSKKAGSGQKPEWQIQLNVAAEIMRRNGYDVRSLHIIALLKDWNKREAGTGTHPATEVMAVDIPLWESSKTIAYIENRITAHEMAKQGLPECSAAETWSGRRCADYCDASSVCLQYQNALKTGLMTENK